MPDQTETKKPKCERCKDSKTVRVLGGGGDYEDGPCPDCCSQEFNLAYYSHPVDAEAE